MSWTMAQRAERLDPSTIREVLKLTEQPGIISLAGGLPAAETFPIDAVSAATGAVLRDAPREALQYATSEGFPPLREWVVAHMAERGVHADPDQVLITAGSQQGLDLVGKVLIDPGSRVAVESPTYLGALQAFSPYEAEFAPIEGDAGGPLPERLSAADNPRLLYLIPNFQNPTGRCLTETRREQIAEELERLRLPLVEDNPYGDLWYDAAPPNPITSLIPDRAIYLGSFSKVLAPGLRLGYIVAPKDVYPKLLQAKQASDLHTSGFSQRIVHEVIKFGFLDDHVPTIRERYRTHRDAMAAALTTHLPDGCAWTLPAGGMFFWVELPAQLDATALLDAAVKAGVAYVPGSSFYAAGGHTNTMRLSFVSVSPDLIEQGVGTLASVLTEALG